ncbi:MAG: M24 family metallopeptidase [Deltaproteobacteria bacterium]|nr:MAG: M24 family metallopeptidase [Deltaproteobacteria bacterium]
MTKRKTSSTKTTQTHDSPYPEAFVAYMMQGWQAPSRRRTPKVRGAARFAARRAALSHAFAGEVLVIPTGQEKVRANDTHYRFRPGSDFYYLTGNLEPDCVLVMWPRAEGHDSILFVEPNPGRSDPAFFMDRFKGELWVGPRLGVSESQARFGVTKAAPLAELPALLRGAAADKARVVRGFDAQVDACLAPRKQEDRALSTHLSEMRLIKDSLEIAALTRACESTRRGFEDVIERLKFGQSEREVEGVFNLRARMEGNDVGYNTIAASGAHACILHWTHNDGGLDDSALLLLDAGIEGNELYTADITRTLPIGGTFSPEQRQIYELVLQAHGAAMAQVKVGNDFMAPNRAAMEVLCRGLCDMGIVRVPYDEAMRQENQFYKRYTLHNVSHMLGIDVHDCAFARAQAYKFGALQAGMVLTIEPGLYLQRDDLTVPKKYRGIGVRIEDDVLVTKRGHRILSELPRHSRDVEKWMQAIWRRASRRPSRF